MDAQNQSMLLRIASIFSVLTALEILDGFCLSSDHLKWIILGSLLSAQFACRIFLIFTQTLLSFI